MLHPPPEQHLRHRTSHPPRDVLRRPGDPRRCPCVSGLYASTTMPCLAHSARVSRRWRNGVRLHLGDGRDLLRLAQQLLEVPHQEIAHADSTRAALLLEAFQRSPGLEPFPCHRPMNEIKVDVIEAESLQARVATHVARRRSPDWRSRASSSRTPLRAPPRSPAPRRRRRPRCRKYGRCRCGDTRRRGRRRRSAGEIAPEAFAIRRARPADPRPQLICSVVSADAP